MSNRSCNGFTEVLERYNEITPVTILSGPTSFAPIIREAIKIVKDQKSVRIINSINFKIVLNILTKKCSIIFW